ncbi:MAG: M23 family metallopeptidase [Alphaproteobacteria bacterium]
MQGKSKRFLAWSKLVGKIRKTAVKPVWLGIFAVVLAYSLAFYEFLAGRLPQTTSSESEALETLTPQSEGILTGEPDPGPWNETLTIKEGDTFMGVLVRLRINPAQAYEMIQALKRFFDPRELKIEQEIEVTYAAPPSNACNETNKLPNPQPTPSKIYDLLEVSLRPEIGSRLRVTRQKNGSFEAVKEAIQLKKQKTLVEGAISVSLYRDALKEGASPQVLHEMIRAFSYDVNFQLDFQPGDQFALYYDTWVDEETGQSQSGKLLGATLTLSGKIYQIYRYKTAHGEEFYNEYGASVRKDLLKTPIDGARLSSAFGKRHHPILGYTKMHKGVDFAAPRGTPIMAAGRGVVERASVYGSYGNYILIRHDASVYKTAYAHLSRYAKGMRKGKRVKQGEIIGYVGTTGRSSGPHLHFEVIKQGQQINPQSVKLLPGQSLQGAELKKFKQHIQTMLKAFSKHST